MTSQMTRPRRRITATIAALAVAAVLSGCGGGPTMTPDDLFERGREANLTFKAAVADVQSQISDDAWDIGQYGGAPEDCADGYSFRLTRMAPEGWRLETDIKTAAQQLGEWLGTNGWSDVKMKTYADGIQDVVVQARNEGALVDRLDVNFKTGEAADSVIVRAESTCQPGDPSDLMAVMYPGWPTDTVDTVPLPETERPDATPIFGFTEDGQPR